MKKFLKSFAVIAGGFAAQSATAAIPNALPQPSKSEDASVGSNTQGADSLAVRTDSGDLFNFGMKRSEETGKMMAYHTSHASHASHRSHYSSRY